LVLLKYPINFLLGLKVEVGDIISEIDGKVTHAMNPDMVAKVIKSTGGRRPISISITKTHAEESKVYGIIKY
jgi:C-terminal processing protease CtpA/Prc